MSDLLTAELLLSRLAALPPEARDAELERLLGIDDTTGLSSCPGPELLGYHPSGVAPALCALLEASAGVDDLFIDLGSGLGKVAALSRLVCGARVRGIEVQQELIARAPRLDGVEFVHADVRHAAIEDGTIFFLYNPFTGSALREVLARLRGVAAHHAIVVCALGVSLEHATGDWLRPRPLEHFWLQVFDSHVPGVPPRVMRPRPVDPRVLQLAAER
jgi:SAM-dependent methyltransferase